METNLAKGGNQPVGFHLVGFHLDNIDSPYGMKKSFEGAYWHAKTIKIHLPHYEIPQPSRY